MKQLLLIPFEHAHVGLIIGAGDCIITNSHDIATSASLMFLMIFRILIEPSALLFVIVSFFRVLSFEIATMFEQLVSI